jgi:Ca2+-binding RTX toxin-like protein
MTSQIVTISNPSVQYELAGTNDFLLIGTGITVGSVNIVPVVDVTGRNTHVVVNGTIMGFNSTIQTTGDDFALTVGEQGSIYVAQSSALNLRGSNASLVNYGTIAGPLNKGFSTISWSPFNAGTEILVNYGNITGDHAIRAVGNAGTAFVIKNYGVIEGKFSITGGGAGSMQLVNRGEIIGNVLMTSGSDRYDGRGGSVDGTVLGATGNDTFLPGLAEETFNGGSGTDTLDFSGARAVTVSLFNGLPNEGRAEGDTYISIENIIGGRRADTLYGDNANNRLDGGFGNDILRGEGGNDVLVGRFGSDTLTGGSGNDQFHFAGPSDGVDTITDFTSGSDRIYVGSAAFGLGLVAGPLLPAMFRSATVNTATGTTDQFVLRTTDKTLWFDADGTNGAGPVQIARFTAGVPVGADFFVF